MTILTLPEKIWLWALMHHKDFHRCTVTFYRSPISIGIHFCYPYTHELIGIGIRVAIPEITLNIPIHIAYDYAEAMKKQGIIVSLDSVLEDIPF